MQVFGSGAGRRAVCCAMGCGMMGATGATLVAMMKLGAEIALLKGVWIDG